MKNLSVSEVFYSIQGEGPTTGIPSVFVRLGGCNLMCGGMGTQHDGKLHDATWRCDTIEVWMKSNSKLPEEVIDEQCLRALRNGAHLIITGGEPLMQQEAIKDFIDYLDNKITNLYIEIETNGTIMPSTYLTKRINQWNCSPKLSNSGNSKFMYFNENVIMKLNNYNTAFKFVLTNMEDWKEVVDTYIPYINRNKIWLMPSGENQELLNESKQVVVEIAKNNFIKFTNRLHIEIWNKKTGV